MKLISVLSLLLLARTALFSLVTADDDMNDSSEVLTPEVLGRIIKDLPSETLGAIVLSLTSEQIKALQEANVIGAINPDLISRQKIGDALRESSDEDLQRALGTYRNKEANSDLV
uniref:Magnesium transporter MgtE intracellular domain-containing protein n=1 Tax=Tetranychus urticae TaxID=32264 RepID=T1KG47_TETUR